ncbi:hypothetical protein BESB_017740 [Besnoitia besnoiti]|uniref:IFT81 calponin homology domain-containing protein n=1 Tax=Besnoitia besnoiti TaxID=94643 RepID=A0A2A9M975_BESBE|nr:hypothetical protein BESB_017740 [Besnoitia besnoiti]PFH32456.1 hypothetical protein BESB_017740 [Besnoitia besnoiti]
MASAQMMKEIVDRLNKPPFSLNTSILAFDQENPQGLLEILNSVLAYIDPEGHQQDLRGENAESLCLRAAESIRVLGYNSSFEGASLAKFLESIEVPAEFLEGDSQLAEEYREYKELQENFRQTHFSLERLGDVSGCFRGFKQEIQRLEREKLLLCEKIEKLRQIANAEGHLVRFLCVARDLRMAQEEETTLSLRSQQQSEYFNYLSDQLDTTRRQLQVMQGMDADAQQGAADFLDVLRDEERRAKNTLGSCMQELEQKRRRLNLLDETEKKLKVYVQQMELLDEKKKAQEEDLRSALAAQHDATLRCSAAENEFKADRGYNFMSTEEFATYAEMLRQKTNLYKTLKLKESEADAANANMPPQSNSAPHAASCRPRLFSKQHMFFLCVWLALHRRKADVLCRVSELRCKIQQAKQKTRGDLGCLLEHLDQAKKEEAELTTVYESKKKEYLSLESELQKPLESVRATIADLQAKVDALASEKEHSRVECRRAERLLEVAAKEQRCAQGEEKYSAQHATFSAHLRASVSLRPRAASRVRGLQRQTGLWREKIAQEV